MKSTHTTWQALHQGPRSSSGRWPPSKMGDEVKSGWFKGDSLNSGWFMSLPKFWVKSGGSLKSGWHGVHCGEMTVTQNWATTVLIPQIWVMHSKLREVKTLPMFTKCLVICLKNSSILLLVNACVVAVLYFSTASPDFEKWVASCTCHIIDFVSLFSYHQGFANYQTFSL